MKWTLSLRAPFERLAVSPWGEGTHCPQRATRRASWCWLFWLGNASPFLTHWEVPLAPPSLQIPTHVWPLLPTLPFIPPARNRGQVVMAECSRGVSPCRELCLFILRGEIAGLSTGSRQVFFFAFAQWHHFLLRQVCSISGTHRRRETYSGNSGRDVSQEVVRPLPGCRFTLIMFLVNITEICPILKSQL